MKRIAQIGTFNVDNLGDLLFPVVFSEIVDEISKETNEYYNIDYFSPNCIQYVPTYSDQKQVIDIDQFNNTPYDKVFIGGGDLLRSDDWSINSIYNSNKLSFTNIISPSNLSISNCYTLGLGVPFELEEDFASFVKNSFTRFNAISVRDLRSQAFLSSKGIDSEIIPDMVLSISKYFPKKLLEENMKEVFKRNNIELERNQYIIFQANDSVLNESEIIGISGLLNAISQRLKIPIILLSIGECLGDNGLYNQLTSLLSDCFVINKERDPELSLRDKVALLAQAQGFIGSSLHGNIISYSYGIPHVTFSGDYSTKLKGFFDLINIKDYCFMNVVDILDKVELITKYLSLSLVNNADLSNEINKIKNFVKDALLDERKNKHTEQFSIQLDEIFKRQQLTINAKNKEISNLWSRVNYAEGNLESVTKQNEELWKRVNIAELVQDQTKDKNAHLTEKVLHLEEQAVQLQKVIDLNVASKADLIAENKHLSHIEQEYISVLSSFKYYMKKKINNRGK